MPAALRDAGEIVPAPLGLGLAVDEDLRMQAAVVAARLADQAVPQRQGAGQE